ncbi:hypothetical protein [Microvirga alba]|uniref:Uncharacterized protein n=1 Tax=Microvirga alba TaxID=2791025 RepID=A0A931BSG5_9HYPH|nr:hypothetical protein [Microvirga alba]MBF9233954.1 hypothetical protein [Microvirga alba]
MSPTLFIIFVVAMVATSPILLLSLGYLAYRWLVSPFEQDLSDEPIGDASLLYREDV